METWRWDEKGGEGGMSSGSPGGALIHLQYEKSFKMRSAAPQILQSNMWCVCVCVRVQVCSLCQHNAMFSICLS